MMTAAIKSLACGLGVTALARRRSGSRCSILMFHGVTAATEGPFCEAGSKHLRVDRLRELLTHIASRYRVVPLSALPTAGGGALPTVALTFDDGYRSNYDLAYPILQALQLPATIFVTTAFVDAGRHIWTDRLEYALGPGKRDRLTALKAQLKSCGPAAIEAGVQAVEREENRVLDAAAAVEYQPMTWAMAREMAAGGLVEIGNHTHTHPILSRCSDAELADELATADALIRAHCGTVSPIMCWPNGKSTDFDDRCLAAARRHGCTGAVTAIAGGNTLPCDPWQLRRFGIHNGTTVSDLEWELSGIAQLLSGKQQ